MRAIAFPVWDNTTLEIFGYEHISKFIDDAKNTQVKPL